MLSRFHRKNPSSPALYFFLSFVFGPMSAQAGATPTTCIDPVTLHTNVLPTLASAARSEEQGVYSNVLMNALFGTGVATAFPVHSDGDNGKFGSSGTDSSSATEMAASVPQVLPGTTLASYSAEVIDANLSIGEEKLIYLPTPKADNKSYVLIKDGEPVRGPEIKATAVLRNIVQIDMFIGGLLKSAEGFQLPDGSEINEENLKAYLISKSYKEKFSLIYLLKAKRKSDLESQFNIVSILGRPDFLAYNVKIEGVAGGVQRLLPDALTYSNGKLSLFIAADKLTSKQYYSAGLLLKRKNADPGNPPGTPAFVLMVAATGGEKANPVPPEFLRETAFTRPNASLLQIGDLAGASDASLIHDSEDPNAKKTDDVSRATVNINPLSQKIGSRASLQGQFVLSTHPLDTKSKVQAFFTGQKNLDQHGTHLSYSFYKVGYISNQIFTNDRFTGYYGLRKSLAGYKAPVAYDENLNKQGFYELGLSAAQVMKRDRRIRVDNPDDKTLFYFKPRLVYSSREWRSLSVTAEGRVFLFPFKGLYGGYSLNTTEAYGRIFVPIPGTKNKVSIGYEAGFDEATFVRNPSGQLVFNLTTSLD